MKSKAPLALMEQLVMMLVFALAAALCVQAFALSDRLSRLGEVRGRAVLEAQNAAEICKVWGSDMAELERRLGGQRQDGALLTFFDADWTPVPSGQEFAYSMEVRLLPGEAGLGRAEIRLTRQDGTDLTTLPVAWQEVGGHG